MGVKREGFPVVRHFAGSGEEQGGRRVNPSIILVTPALSLVSTTGTDGDGLVGFDGTGKAALGRSGE